MSEEALRRCVTDGDPAARAALADWLEEHGRDREAAFHRWLLAEPDVLHGDTRDPDDPWSWCVYVTLEALPAGMEELLPAPIVAAPGEGRIANWSIPSGDRVLEDLWVNREAAERDLLAAWLALPEIRWWEPGTLFGESA